MIYFDKDVLKVPRSTNYVWLIYDQATSIYSFFLTKLIMKQWGLGRPLEIKIKS